MISNQNQEQKTAWSFPFYDSHLSPINAPLDSEMSEYVRLEEAWIIKMLLICRTAFYAGFQISVSSAGFTFRTDMTLEEVDFLFF